MLKTVVIGKYKLFKVKKETIRNYYQIGKTLSPQSYLIEKTIKNI